MKSPNPAGSRRFSEHSPFQHFSSTQTPHFPRFWSGHRLFQRPSCQKQFPSSPVALESALKLKEIFYIHAEGDHATAECMDDFITVPPCHPLVATIPAVVALQICAYHVARIRGCEIDQPWNLAKSVTVE